MNWTMFTVQQPLSFLGSFWDTSTHRFAQGAGSENVPEDVNPQEVQQREMARTAVKEELHQASGWAETHISEACIS